MRIGLQAPRKEPRIAGAATFEQELFEGLMVGIGESTHTLVVFSRQPRPTNLAQTRQVEWVQVHAIAWRNLGANLRRVINLFFNGLLHWPSPFRHEHWIDGYLQDHRVEFMLNLIPETIPTEVPYMTFIWDLMHRGLSYFPECSQRGAWIRRETQLGLMIRKAAILAVGTEVGKREVMNFYQIPEDRLHILPFPTPRFALVGALQGDAVQSPLPPGFEDEYALFPGSYHAHKNHVLVLYALAFLRDHHQMTLHAMFSGGDWGNLA